MSKTTNLPEINVFSPILHTIAMKKSRESVHKNLKRIQEESL